MSQPDCTHARPRPHHPAALRRGLRDAKHRARRRAASTSSRRPSASGLPQLESTVGNVLLERHRRGVVPTPAPARSCWNTRARMLAGADRVARDMAALRQGHQGPGARARHGVVHRRVPAGRHRELPAGARAPRHPHRHRGGAQPRPRRGLREGAGAAGVCWDAADLEGLQTRGPIATTTSRSSRTRRTRSRGASGCAFEQTLDYDHVGLPASTAVHTMLARAAAIIGSRSATARSCQTFDASLRCVRANLGIAVVPREVAQPCRGQFRREGGAALRPLGQAQVCASAFATREALSPAAKLLLAHLERLASARAK